MPDSIPRGHSPASLSRPNHLNHRCRLTESELGVVWQVTGEAVVAALSPSQVRGAMPLYVSVLTIHAVIVAAATPSNRRRAQDLISLFGGSNSNGEYAALSALVGASPDKDTLMEAGATFRLLPLDKLRLSDLPGSGKRACTQWLVRSGL